MIEKTFPTLVMVILASWAACGVAVPSLVRRKRKRKRRGDYLEKVEHKEDLISQLPDDVLVSIIARIPTRTAVTTSILSKRWRNLHKSVSSIELSYIDLMPQYPRPRPCPNFHISRSDFDSAIHSVEIFLRRSSGSELHSASLCAKLTELNDKQFEKFIYYLGKSNVERLRFLFRYCPCCPPSRFSCDLVSELATLKDLVLGMCSLLLPKLKGKWNSLTNLSLQMCTVPPGFLECILSNCSNLESLTISCCVCPPKLCIVGPSLRLKTLSIRITESIEEIELHASNLSKFEYSTGKMANLVFDYVPQLEIMYMSIKSGDHKWVNAMPYIFGEVAKYVPSLKSLRFETKPYFNQGMWIGRSRFAKLRVLNMTIGWTPRPSNLLELIPYLESCPVLEALQLNVESCSPTVMEFVLQLPEVVGGASNEVIEMRELKKVEINGFNGTDNEIEFALFILKSALSLHQMCITRCPKEDFGSIYWNQAPWTEQTFEKIKQSLLGQALSPNARLILSYQS